MAAALVAGACGSEVTTADDDDGGMSVGAGGKGGSGGSVVARPEVDGASAPTQFSVRVAFRGGLPAWAADGGRYGLRGPGGPLVIEGIDVDAAADTVILTTAKQKLGLDYTLTVVTDEREETRTFPSADTATFWTTDLSSPNFDEVEITAARAETGTHGVIYLELGFEGTAGVASAMQRFDDAIYPVETQLFTEPADIDENGKIVLLGLDGANAYGGYFSPIHSLPNELTMSQWGVHSNEMEMVYINVVGGDFDDDVVLPHEFEHLLYNERHGVFGPDWPYHNEGLAECAVRAVNGVHGWALDYLVADPNGGVARGPSLVHWDYGNYDNYVLAYVFWSYIAGQLGGSDTYGQLFELDGSPAAVQAFVQQQLGLDFADVQLRALAASFAQAPTGPAGFGGLLSFPGKPPTASGGALDLEPFAGLMLAAGVASSLDVPGGAGPNLVFAGVNGSGEVDFTAPFDVGGGVLVALNARFDESDPTPEPVGTPVSSFAPGPSAHAPLDHERAAAASRLHPPPFHPGRLERMRAWQRAVGLRP